MAVGATRDILFSDSISTSSSSSTVNTSIRIGELEFFLYETQTNEDFEFVCQAILYAGKRTGVDLRGPWVHHMMDYRDNRSLQCYSTVFKGIATSSLVSPMMITNSTFQTNLCIFYLTRGIVQTTRSFPCSTVHGDMNSPSRVDANSLARQHRRPCHHRRRHQDPHSSSGSCPPQPLRAQ